MSKEEFLKIQTCVLKVNIHCDGCKQKVKKILQKIDGVYTIKIDSEQGKVTVSGNIDAATLVKKLAKNGKHAEIWGASKANNHNHQNQLNNHLKNMHIDNGKVGNNKGQGQKNGGNNMPKGGPQGQIPQIQQLQQLQQLKGFQDLKIPPQLMKDMRMPINNKDQNQKAVKFSLPEDEDMTDDDDYDDDDYDDDDDDDDYDDDEMDDMPVHNKKPVMGNGHGGAQMPNMMMNNMMKGVGNAGNNGGGNLKKGGGGGVGGGGNIPVQMNLGGANGGKKGGNGNNNGGSQNQGGGKGGKNGGGQTQDVKNGGGQNKNGNGGGGAGNGSNFNANGAKNGVGMKDMHNGMMPNMMNVGQMGKSMPMPMGQMGNLPMSQMGNLSAVQGLPASAATGGGGYFPGGANPEQMAGNNPYYQQQLATMMMNQQRANGNERFHPMMYARPPPAVNYMPPYPPYPYPPPPGERVDQYSMFSDENTSSCTVM